MPVASQRSKAEATAARIVEAAETLFLAQSYADVTVDMIAATAAVTKGGLYHHFESKEQLYLPMLHRDLDAKRELFVQMAEQPHKRQAVAVINIDDEYGRRLAKEFASRLEVVTYGCGIHADFRAVDIRFDFNGAQGDFSNTIESWYTNVIYVEATGSGYTFYAYQEGEGGIAEALDLAEYFAGGDDICVVLQRSS